MIRRLQQVLVLAACLAATLAPTAAQAQTTGASGAANGAKKAAKPKVVEPAVGKPAPAPVDTPPPVTTSVIPVPQPTVTQAPVQPAGAVAGASGASGPQGVRRSDGGLSDTAVGAIIAGGVLLLLALLALAVRSSGWSSYRTTRWRHAAGEANWRLSLRAAEFRDFLKLGR